MCLSTVKQKIRPVPHGQLTPGTPQSRKMAGALPLSFQNGATWAEVPFWVISWFVKIDLNQIYCSYSRNKNIQNVFFY